MTTSPLIPVINKIRAGSSVNVQMCGDSTVDGGSDSAGLQGICGRLGIHLGGIFNTTVRIAKLSGSVYGSFRTLSTGTGSNFVDIYNGGVSGSTITKQIIFLDSGLIPVTPDIVFLATSFNDQSGFPAAFVNVVHTFIDTVTTRYPDVPIVITTQNVAGGVNAYIRKEIGSQLLLSATATDLLGTTVTLPLSTRLAKSTTNSNVWILDTKQAFNYTWTATESYDGLHPSALGYTVEADWMFSALTTAGTSPTITTDLLNPVIQGVGFSQTLTGSGTDPITWALSAGSLPDGLTISASGLLSGTPRAYGDYDFTLSVTNSFGSDILRYTGTITNPAPALPFVPDTATRTKYRLIGQYYPVVPKIKSSGVFKRVGTLD